MDQAFQEEAKATPRQEQRQAASTILVFKKIEIAEQILMLFVCLSELQSNFHLWIRQSREGRAACAQGLIAAFLH